MAPRKIPNSRIMQHFLTLPDDKRVELLSKNISKENIRTLGASELYRPLIELGKKPEAEAREFLRKHFANTPEQLKQAISHGESLAGGYRDAIYSKFSAKTEEDKLYALVRSQTLSNRLRIFYDDLTEKGQQEFAWEGLATLKNPKALTYYMEDPRNYAAGRSPKDFFDEVAKTMDLSNEKSVMDHLRTGVPENDPERKAKIQLAAQMFMVLPEGQSDPEVLAGKLKDKDWKKKLDIKDTIKHAQSSGRLPVDNIVSRIKDGMNDIPETEEEKALFKEAALQTCQDIKGALSEDTLNSKGGQEFLEFHKNLQAEITLEALKQPSVQNLKSSLAQEYQTLLKEKSGWFLSKTNSPEYNNMMKHLRLFNAKMDMMNGRDPQEPLTEEELKTVQDTDAEKLLANAKQGCYNYGTLKTKNGTGSIWHEAGNERFASSMKTLQQLGELGEKLHLSDPATTVRDNMQLEVLKNRGNREWLKNNLEDAVAKTICAQVLLNKKEPAYMQRTQLEGDAFASKVEKIKSSSSFQTMMKNVSKEQIADAIIKGGGSLYEVYNKADRIANSEGQRRTASEIEPNSLKPEKGDQGLVPGPR